MGKPCSIDSRYSSNRGKEAPTTENLWKNPVDFGVLTLTNS